MKVFQKDIQIGEVHLELTGALCGADLSISLVGGDLHHIGAVAVGAPRPSLDNKEIVSSSASLIVLPSHREDMLVYEAAQKMAKVCNCTVVFAAGVHVEGITFEQHQQIQQGVDRLVVEAIEEYFRQVEQ